MKTIGLALTSAAMLLALSACTDTPDIAIRERTTGLAAGSQGAAFRVGEARAHFRLGNVALAAEGFRRALREDPTSIDAMNGLAACYDRLGRFDLSRSFYERALAVAPHDPRLYANLATSLTLQGKDREAAAVRAELAERLGASESIAVALAVPAVPVAAPAEVPEAAQPAPAGRVSIPLAEASPPSRAADPAIEAVGPRLERVGLAEVVLVTESRPPRAFVERVPVPASHSPVKSARANAPSLRPMAITILNAARIDRLAASTRTRLQRLGWREVAIGDAPRVLARSQLSFPERRRAEAERLARQLGITASAGRPAAGNRLVLILGRDQAARRTGA